jgi:hypothetical protein
MPAKSSELSWIFMVLFGCWVRWFFLLLLFLFLSQQSALDRFRVECSDGRWFGEEGASELLRRRGGGEGEISA